METAFNLLGLTITAAIAGILIVLLVILIKVFFLED